MIRKSSINFEAKKRVLFIGRENPVIKNEVNS